ncbi:dihydrofolate reductase family protein [Amphibacillus sp. Q70]|uniref:dihydrofolate reductase family protein n=1 Tax=Amphibacillus sp. Q70 TaxID=3453416 RepID=UPI003F87DD47
MEINNRPYVFCHMLTSLDGKVIGNFMDIPESSESHQVFYDIAFGEERFYQHSGWLSGRMTSDYNYTYYKKPELDESSEEVPAGDFIAEQDLDMYYISIDSKGVLAWETAEISFKQTKAHVVEVLSEKASNAYKAYLRQRHISYIICGEKTIDFELMLTKLKDIFKMETVMLGGGGVLNWSFIQQGLCDELSQVIARASDGSNQTPALFDEVEGLSDDRPVGFKLINVDSFEKGTIWLRYKVGDIYESERWIDKSEK